MAIYHVKSSGSNTSPYETWAKGATALLTVTALAVTGDIIVTDNAFSQALGTGTTTYTVADGVYVISTSDTTHDTPTVYATGAALSTSSGGSITIRGGAWRGFNFSLGTSNNAPSFSLGGDDASTSLEDSVVTFVATGTANLLISNASAGNCLTRTRNMSVFWGGTGQGFQVRGNWHDIGSNLDAGTTHPLTLIKQVITSNAEMTFNGSDFSGNTGTLFTAGATTFTARLTNCDVNVGVSAIFATQTGDDQGEVWLFDCDHDDTHYKFGHFNYRGNTVVSTSKYVTADGSTYDGTNKYSLQITGSNASAVTPYYGQWIDVYTAGGSSVTPYLEVLRDGSATALTDNEIWAETMAKTTSGSTRSTLYTDRMTLLGTAANQATGTGTSNWTGASGTAWSGKIDSGAAITPQEIGYVRMRPVLASNTTVNVCAKVRGLGVTNVIERVTPTGIINDTALSAGGSSVALPPVRMAA